MLLFSRVCIRITVSDGKLSAVFSYLFLFKRPIYPTSKRKKKRINRKKKKAEVSSAARAPQEKKQHKLRAFVELRALLEAILEKMPHTFTLRVRRLSLTVGSDDPAKTALLYGSASTAFSLFLEWLDRKLFTLHRERDSILGVNADFEAQQISLDADLRLTATPFRLLRLSLTTLLPHYIKRLKRKKKAKKSASKKSL